MDEIVFIDVNGEPGLDPDCDPGVDSSRESERAGQGDSRDFFRQDRNWNEVVLIDYDPNSANAANGRVAERKSFTPRVKFAVLWRAAKPAR